MKHSFLGCAPCCYGWKILGLLLDAPNDSWHPVIICRRVMPFFMRSAFRLFITPLASC